MRKSYIREKKIRCGDEYMAVGVYAVTDQEHRKRGKKRKESDKGQKNRNKAASMRKKQRKVLANFDKRGFFLTGTYEDCYLPDDEAACWKDVENYARTDRAKDLPAAFGADRQDDAVLQAGLPEGAVQRFQPCVDLPERGEDLFWVHVPHAGQVQLPRQSL